MPCDLLTILRVERSLRQFWPILWICVICGVSVLAQPNDSQAEIIHVVGAGENLSAIAANYGVTVGEIVATNDLDLNAILQVGQQIVIVFNTAVAEPSAATLAAIENNVPSATEVAAGEARAIGGIALDNDLPPAPVAAADAPAMDPAAFDPVICVSTFVDDNRNGAMDPGEPYLAESRIKLLDSSGNQHASRSTDSESRPLCIKDLQPQIYFIEVAAPVGYGPTSSDALRIDLRDGRPVQLAFGAKLGFVHEEPSPVISVATEEPPENLDIGEGLLQELSGLFVVALAIFVLVSGLSVALFLRFR